MSSAASCVPKCAVTSEIPQVRPSTLPDMQAANIATCCATLPEKSGWGAAMICDADNAVAAQIAGTTFRAV